MRQLGTTSIVESIDMSLFAVLCWAALLFSAFTIALNWYAFFRAWRARQNYSFMPASIFAIGGAGAAALHPDREVSSLFWVPLALDPGLGCFVVVLAIRRLFRRS